MIDSWDRSSTCMGGDSGSKWRQKYKMSAPGSRIFLAPHSQSMIFIYSLWRIIFDKSSRLCWEYGGKNCVNVPTARQVPNGAEKYFYLFSCAALLQSHGTFTNNFTWNRGDVHVKSSPGRRDMKRESLIHFSYYRAQIHFCWPICSGFFLLTRLCAQLSKQQHAALRSGLRGQKYQTIPPGMITAQKGAEPRRAGDNKSNEKLELQIHCNMNESNWSFVID